VPKAAVLAFKEKILDLPVVVPTLDTIDVGARWLEDWYKARLENVWRL